MPIAGVAQHDLGVTEINGCEFALGGADHRFEMPEVRGLGRDLGCENDLPVVDRHLRVVALQRRLAVRANHTRVVVGDVHQPLRRDRRLVGLEHSRRHAVRPVGRDTAHPPGVL
jgi:hypothetical protein